MSNDKLAAALCEAIEVLDWYADGKHRVTLSGPIDWPTQRAKLAADGFAFEGEAGNGHEYFVERGTKAEAAAGAARLCCGRRAPDDMIDGWLTPGCEDNRLQHFAADNGPAWAQGIVLLDAADLLAETPTEGVEHGARPTAQSPAQAQPVEAEQATSETPEKTPTGYSRPPNGEPAHPEDWNAGYEAGLADGHEIGADAGRLPVAWMYEHDGCNDEPILTAVRWPECREPWNETPLDALALAKHAIEKVWLDAVGTGNGEHSISEAARARVEFAADALKLGLRLPDALRKTGVESPLPKPAQPVEAEQAATGAHGTFPAPDLRGIDGATHSEWRFLRVPENEMLIQEKDLPKIIKRACLAYVSQPAQPVEAAQAENLRRDYARALDTIKGHAAQIGVLEQHIRELRAFQAMVNRHAPEFPDDPDGPRDVWYWQGDGRDHLESMTHQLPVVIRAEQLRELLAARPAQPVREPMSWDLFVAACEAEYGEEFCPNNLGDVSDEEKAELMRVVSIVERHHGIGSKGGAE